MENSRLASEKIDNKIVVDEKPHSKLTLSTPIKKIVQFIRDILYPEMNQSLETINKESSLPMEFSMGRPTQPKLIIEHEKCAQVIEDRLFYKQDELTLSKDTLKKNYYSYYTFITVEALLRQNASYQEKFGRNFPCTQATLLKNIASYFIIPFIEKLRDTYMINYPLILFDKDGKFGVISSEIMKKHSQNITNCIETPLCDSNQILMDDLISEASLSHTSTLIEAFEKMTDGDKLSFVSEITFNYNHYLNYTMSPLAFSLACFLNAYAMKPKVTYIAFSCVYSETEIQVLKKASQNIQIIVIYDSRTGGPSLNNFKEEFFSQGLNKNLILLPIEIKNISNKIFFPNDLLVIFQSIILPLVRSFNPNLIAFSHALICNHSIGPFWIDPHMMKSIIRLLQSVSNGKLIFYPFKVKQKSKEELDLFLSQMAEDLRKRNYQENKITKIVQENLYICQNYAKDYDRKYYRDCLTNILEVLSLHQKPKKFKDSILNQSKIELDKNKGEFCSSKNPYLYKNLENWKNFYRGTPNEKYFETKHFNIAKNLARLLFEKTLEKNENYIENFYLKAYDEKKLCMNTNDKFNACLNLTTQKKIPIYMENLIVFLKLDDYIMIDDSSQYYVHYGMNLIEIYLMNAIDKKQMIIKNFQIKLQNNPRKFQNLLSFESEKDCDGIKKGNKLKCAEIVFNDEIRDVLHYHEISSIIEALGEQNDPDYNNKPEVMAVQNMGLAYLEDTLFCCYGKLIYNFLGSNAFIQKEFDKIMVYTKNSDKFQKLNVKFDKKTHVPRYNPSALAFKLNHYIYLVVTGGERLARSEIDKIHYYNILNLVEVYRAPYNEEIEISDLEYEYFNLNKETLFDFNKIGYKPYLNSYLYQSGNKLMIFGGHGIEGSIDEKLINFYEVQIEKNPDDWKFMKHMVFENIIQEAKECDEIIAIGDSNRNITLMNENDNLNFIMIYFHKGQSFCTKFQVNVGKVETSKIRITFPSETDKSVSKISSSRLPEMDLMSKVNLKYLISIQNFTKELLEAIETKIFNELINFSSCLERAFSRTKKDEKIDFVLKNLSSQDWPRDLLIYLKNQLNKAVISPKSERKFKFGDEALNFVKDKSLMRVQKKRYDLIKQNSQSKTNLFVKSMLTKKIPMIESDEIFESFVNKPSSQFRDSPNNKVQIFQNKNQFSYKPINRPTSYHRAGNLDGLISKEEDTKLKMIGPLKSYPVHVERSMLDSSSILAKNKDIEIKKFKFSQLEDFNDNKSYFLNKTASEITIYDFKNIYRLKFFIMINETACTIDFKHSPKSIYIFKGILYALIDSEFRHYHPLIYEKYKNSILYAPLMNTYTKLKLKNASKGRIILKKLIDIEISHGFVHRSLVVTDKYFFLIGGKRYSQDDEECKLSSSVWKIEYRDNLHMEKVKEEELSLSLDEKSENYAAVQVTHNTENFVYICKESNPKYIYQLSEKGIINKLIRLPQDKKLATANNVKFFKIKIQDEIKLMLIYLMQQDNTNSGEAEYKHQYYMLSPMKKSKLTQVSFMQQKSEIGQFYAIFDEDTIMLDHGHTPESLLIRRYEESKIDIISLCPEL